ncbi:lysosome membrane protein 2-like [Diadema setosum]|uniref:lysosome membrane protein 2-like n=1 Tax=Diadema setosum TaxID=31175 RepID=UPI003B3BD725
MCKPTMTKVLVTGTVGAVLLILGCVLIPVGEEIVRGFVIADVVIENGTTAYESWLTPPTPVFMQFWFWDLTNPEEFLNGGVPFMEEKGPYTYQEFRAKENIEWNENDTVSFNPKTMYVFREDLSVGPDTDLFTTVNLPAITLANLAQNDPTLEAIEFVLNTLSGASTVIEIPVGGMIWGYEDAYLKFLEPFLAPSNISTKFGIFMGSNDTLEGTWTVNTGKGDINLLGEVEVWDGKTSLEWWSSDEANMINGTDGTAFRPFLTPDDQLYVYVDDLCRSGFLSYDYSGSIRGIPVSHFSVPDLLYANVSYYPDNLGFCTPPGNLPCVPNGLLNVSNCQPGNAPIYFSSPHFLYGDPSLFEAVHGMNPVRSEHETSFDVEMLTGIAFQVHNRLQINVRVDSNLQMRDARQISEAYFPIFWLNESSVVDEANADFFISDALVPQYILFGLIVLLIAVGGGLFLGAVATVIIVQCDKRRYRRKNSLLDGEKRRLDTM